MGCARVYVDVSELPAPEPLAAAMDAATRLRAGEYLQVHHWREPVLLYERLIGNGFAFDTRVTGDDDYEIFVWRTDDDPACRSAKAAAGELENVRKK